jgi:hypothetical protein
MTGAGRGTPAGGSPPTSWNSSDKSANITLTNSNLTAAGTVAGFSSVRAVASHSTGKFYYEIHLDTNPSGEDVIAGITNSTFNVSGGNFVGQDNNGIGFDPDASLTWLNNVNVAAPHGVINDVLGIAVDIGGTTFQCNINGGAFTSRSFTTMVAGPYFPCVALASIGTTITTRFASGSWTGSPPAGGYVQW